MTATTTDSGHHTHALERLLGAKARVAVLRPFLLDPTRAYYQRQLEAATGLPIRAVQRELERLQAVGLLYRRAEGNRSYFNADQEFPLFPELRAMFLKAGTERDRLHGQLALAPGLRLLFLAEDERRALAVNKAPIPDVYAGTISLQFMNPEEFSAALAARAEVLEAFLSSGVDLLGRRDDPLWRRIEAAGFAVAKGEGIP